MQNVDIRNLIDQANLKHWEVAKEIGIGYSTFCVWLREELPDDKKETIKNAIEKLRK